MDLHVLSNIVRFRGSIQQWKNYISQYECNDRIVFGKVHDENSSIYKDYFYAGKNQQNDAFEYILADASCLAYVADQISILLDGETATKSIEQMIQDVVSNYYTKSEIDEKFTNVDSSLLDLKTYIDSEIDECKASIVDLSTNLKEYIDNNIEYVSQEIIDLSVNIKNYIDDNLEIINNNIVDISSHTNKLDEDVSVISSVLSEYVNIVDEYIEETNEKIKDIDSSIEKLKIVDISLDNKIENVSIRLAELEIGTVDSIYTNTPQYLNIDTSKGDVTININCIDSSIFENNALVTNGYLEEKLLWYEIL